MARHGQNPMRWVKKTPSLAKITIVTIIYIPHLDGYFEESLDVLKLCFESLRENTHLPFDLYVFDNGSCDEVINYLQDQQNNENIDCLIFSKKNIGKVGAWNFLFGAAPGEYICYMDSDIYFLKDWLKDTLEIFNSFPKAGMVTAQPARRNLPNYCHSTINGARENKEIKIEEGDLIPESYIKACALGLGRTVDEYSKIIDGQNDILLTTNEIQAFISADHFQFVIKKELIKSLLPFTNVSLLGPKAVYQLDEQVDNKKAWRLSTTKFLVHHLGNKIPKTEDEKNIVFRNINKRNVLSHKMSNKNKGLKNRFLRLILKEINIWTYKLLYNKNEKDL